MEKVENILQLPDEILRKILSYVPKKWEVVLVCSKMYETVCAVEMNKFRMKVIEYKANEVSFNSRLLTLHFKLFFSLALRCCHQ